MTRPEAGAGSVDRRRALDLIEDATEVRFKAATHALDGLDPVQKKQLSDLLRTVLNAQGDLTPPYYFCQIQPVYIFASNILT